MKQGQKLWTREELVLAISLYCKLPFGRLHARNPEIINLAKIINRTSGSLAFKLVNFASLDPTLKARGIKGATNASNLDREIWNEFYNNWDQLPYESEKLLANLTNTTIEELYHINETELPKEGKTREALVKVRVNQSFFRKMIMSSYNNTCCITGLTEKTLLIAGHIKPWSNDESNRMNPQNGIAINPLHDEAFENGLITITPDFKIKVSPILKKQEKDKAIKALFLKYDRKPIILPSRFLPDVTFLEYHNDRCFRNN